MVSSYLFHLGIKCMLWVTCLNYLVCLFARSTVRLVLQLLSLEEPWTLILDDALANSFVAPATDDIQDDHQLTCKYLKWFPGLFKVDKWLDFLTDAVHILVMDKDVDIDCFIEHHGDVELSQRSEIPRNHVFWHDLVFFLSPCVFPDSNIRLWL